MTICCGPLNPGYPWQLVAVESLTKLVDRKRLLQLVQQYANLEGAELSRADLHGANLMGANLGGANLKKANLISAIMPDGRKKSIFTRLKRFTE